MVSRSRETWPLRSVRLAPDIEGSDLTTRELRATSSGGDIVATFANRPDRVAVESSGGDIQLVVPAGRYRVEAQSSGGGVQVDVVQDPDAANLLIAKSSGGDIQIRPTLIDALLPRRRRR